MSDPILPDLNQVENQGPTINLGPDQFHFDPVEAANQSAGIAPQSLHNPKFTDHPERETLRSILNDRANLGGKMPQAVNDSKADENPQDFRDLAANIKALSMFTGKDPADITPNYEQEKQSFVKSQGWDMPNSEGAFNGQIRDYFNAQDARQQALDDLHSRAILDAGKGISSDDAFQTSWQEWNTAHASALAGVPEAEAFNAWKKGYWNNLKQLQGDHHDLAQEIVDLYGNLPKGQQEAQAIKDQASLAIEGLKAPIGLAGDQPALKADQAKEAQKKQLLDRLAAIPKEERQKVYQRAAAIEKAKNPAQYGWATSLYSLGQSLGRSVDWLSPESPDLSTTHGRMALELKHAARDIVNPLPYSEINAWDATKAGAPVIGTKVAQGLTGAIPTIGAFALTGQVGALAYMLGQTTVENRDRLLVANPSMTPKEALSFGYLMAVPEVALMSITFLGLKGAFPSLEKALADWGAGKMFVANTAVGGMAFSASGLAGSLADSAINSLNAEWNPDASIKKGLKETLLNAPQDFAMAAAFALLHIGHKPDAVSGKKEADQAIADVQKPDAPKLVTTADGGKVIVSTDEKGQPKEVFKTKDPAVAVSALEIVHEEQRSKEAGKGNDWTEATRLDGQEPKPAQVIDTTGAEEAASDQLKAQDEATPTQEPQGQPQASRLVPDDHPIIYMDPKELKLSQDVPNFKEGAHPDTGVVEGQELQGKLDLKGMGPIMVWERANGDREVISGRHRLDLAKRTDAPLVPIQVLKETEGFTKQDAMTLDAEQNIKDEKGSVKDYAHYFRNSQITRDEAEAGGLLSRAKGRAGFSIGSGASDDLYALFSAGKISEAKAAAIAQSAPKDAGLQQAAMSKAADLKAEEIPGYIALLKREGAAGSAEQIGLFGEDESFLKEAERLSKAAAARVRELSEQIAAVQGAAKRPEAAAKLGVDVKDPQGLEKKIAELKDQRERFSQFWLHDDLMSQLGAKPRTPTIDANGEGNLFHEKDMPFSLSGQTEQAPEAKEPPKYREDDQTGYFVMEKPEVQAYLDFAHVPEEKRQQAETAFKQVAKASTTPYERRKVSASGGMDGDELRQAREEQAAAYRGLLGGDVEAVKSAIENGVPLSKLIGAYAKGDHAPFSIQGAIINSPADLAAHNLAHRTPFFESLKIAVLDNSNQVIHSEVISIGSLNESIAHPREIIRGIERGKSVSADMGRTIQGWMLMHNHPSGDPSPSEADRRLTRRLDEVAKLMEVPLLDHVITNGETYFSFTQAGLHGGGVKYDPKLKPKLQTIPKPEGLKQGNMADWEAVPASHAETINAPGFLKDIRATLQTADPGMIHVLNLNTRYGLISVDRHPLNADPGQILKESSKHGTYAIALSFPDTNPDGTPAHPEDASAAWRPFVRKMAEVTTLYQMPLVDAAVKDFSWRNAGLLEEPGKYAPNSSTQENPDHVSFQSARPEDQQGKGNKVAPAPTFKDKAKIAAGKVLDSIRDLPADSDFKREVLKWSARSQASTNEIERVQRQIEKSIPDAVKRDGITNWIEAGGDKELLRERADATTDAKLKAGYEAALNFTPEEVAIADKVKQTFGILETRAKRYGIEMGHRENYVPHVFEQEPQPPSGTTAKRLSEFFKFSQTRVFDSYFEGEQITDKEGKPAPYKAQTKDIAKLLGLYMNDMNNAINSRRFVADLSKAKASDGRPVVSPRGGGTATTGEHGEQETHLVYPDLAKDGHEDYKIVDQPALHDWTFAGKDDLGANIMVKGDLAVHPEVAKHLENVLGSSAITKWLNTKSENPFLNGGKWVAKKLIKGQNLTKGTMLSFSPFHQVQEAIHALGHRVNPFADIPKIDLRDPKQADAAAHGLMLSHDRLSQSLFMEGVGDNSSNLVTMGLRKIGWGLTTEAADKVDAYQHWLFSQYIPGLKYKTYEHILERNMERYKEDIESGAASEWQVKVLSAKQANAAYGHLNYAEMGHNPTIRHAMQLALLAPDFLEARSRFVGQASKGLAGGKVGSEQLQALAFLAITQFVTATIQKVFTNGDPEFDHPFEMRFGNKYYGVRSVPEDIYKLFGNPAGFIGGRISPIFGRFLQEGIFGVNYRGERTSAGDAIADILAGIVPMPMQTLTRQWTTGGKSNPISPIEQILSSAGVQVHRYSPITKVYPLAHDWVKKNYPEDIQKGTYPVSKFQQLRYALEDNDTEAANKEVERLVSGGMKSHDIGKAFKASVNHPFTGSKTHDEEFYKSLDEDGKQRVDAAIERRKVILQRFNYLKSDNHQ